MVHGCLPGSGRLPGTLRYVDMLDVHSHVTCSTFYSHAESVEVERSELRRLEERVRQLEGEARQQAEEKTTAINRLTRERG